MCFTPVIITVTKGQQAGTAKKVPVPCGKCKVCLSRRAASWAFRLMYEERRALSAWFITLTYAPEFVPKTPKKWSTLRKRDLQLFFKRLRRAHVRKYGTNAGIKYFAVGEYGGKFQRPHYHMVIFNIDVELVEPAWEGVCNDVKMPIGSIYFGKVSGASVGYTLKYIQKKGMIPTCANDDRIPEFSLMSKGLGANYLTDKIIRWHHADINNRMYCNAEGGKKIAMPRYYKEKIYTEMERKAVGFHALQSMLNRRKNIDIDAREQIEAHLASFRLILHKNHQDVNLT